MNFEMFSLQKKRHILEVLTTRRSLNVKNRLWWETCFDCI